MKKLKFKSLTIRIWTTFTAIILIIILSISFIYLFAFRRIDENAKIHDLKIVHDILLKDNDFNEYPRRFDELKNLRGSEHFIVNIDENNNLRITDIKKRKDMMSTPYSFYDNMIKSWMVTFIKETSLYEKQFKENYKNRRFLFILSSIDNGDKTTKSYLISYVPSMEDNSILYIVIWIGVIFIAIGFLTAKIVASYISKPLKELEAHTIRIANKDWKEPIKLKSEDEIGRLAIAMNQMQKELKRADEDEKMFLQSISHDLKTPVMVIMSHAEAIIDGVYIDSVEQTAEIIRDESINLEKKIKQLLFLNTLDYVLENNNENTEINLSELLNNMVSRFEVINSEIEWELSIDKIIIHGNLDKVKVAIENVLDNELRYAEKKISITLKEEAGFSVLEIYNDGSRIDDKHINNIFDNHYKDKTGNFGLGLAISKKIISFYKGEIKAINREKGVSFIIKLLI
jgi:two-component system sensor histidine kinase CssS